MGWWFRRTAAGKDACAVDVDAIQLIDAWKGLRVRDNPLRLLGLVFGTVYLVVGLMGFAVTGFGNLIGSVGDLAVFQLNPLHNLAHIVIGLLWLLSAANTDTARAAAQLFGTVYLALSILGFLAVGAALNALALNMGDNVLHLVSGGGALLIGVFAQRRPAKPSTPERFADLRS